MKLTIEITKVDVVRRQGVSDKVYLQTDIQSGFHWAPGDKLSLTFDVPRGTAEAYLKATFGIENPTILQGWIYMKYDNQTFMAWIKRAIEVANVARGDSNTDFHSISPSDKPGCFTARGDSYCCGSTEGVWEEIPLAYMLLTDEEIVGEERIRNERAAGVAAQAEMDRQRILAEEKERQEYETYQRLKTKFEGGNCGQRD